MVTPNRVADHRVGLLSPRNGDFNVINQISLKADSLATLKTMHARVGHEGTSDITPVTHGNSLSVYLRDPEGNRLELYFELPWYVDQPMRVPVDLEKPDEEIMEAAERHARALPGFKTRTQWRQEMAARMGIA